jgi:hypothetical protein
MMNKSRRTGCMGEVRNEESLQLTDNLGDLVIDTKEVLILNLKK